MIPIPVRDGEYAQMDKIQLFVTVSTGSLDQIVQQVSALVIFLKVG